MHITERRHIQTTRIWNLMRYFGIHPSGVDRCWVGPLLLDVGPSCRSKSSGEGHAVRYGISPQSWQATDVYWGLNWQCI